MERVAQKVAIEGDAVMLPPGRTIDVVVDPGRELELSHLVGKRRETAVEVPVVAVLRRELKSLDERYATQVLVNMYPVGRLSRADAAAYGPILERLVAEGLHGACEGRIIADRPPQSPRARGQGGATQHDYGVKLWLALPEHIEAYLDKGTYRAAAFDPRQTPMPVIPWSLPDRSRRMRGVGCFPILIAGAVLLATFALPLLRV
jgi:hypothetical protein